MFTHRALQAGRYGANLDRALGGPGDGHGVELGLCGVVVVVFCVCG
jgi:hypothetical protein